MTGARVREVVRDAGADARGIVTYRLPGDVYRHAANVVNFGGAVVFLDGQADRVGDLPADATDVSFLPMFGLTDKQRGMLDLMDLVASEPVNAVTEVTLQLRGDGVIWRDGTVTEPGSSGTYVVELSGPEPRYLPTQPRPTEDDTELTGAGGGEYELLNTRVELPGVDFDTVLVTSHRFKLVVDARSDKGFRVEVVTDPMRMLDGETGQLDRADPVKVFTDVRDAIERLQSIPLGEGRPLVELFPLIATTCPPKRWGRRVGMIQTRDTRDVKGWPTSNTR